MITLWSAICDYYFKNGCTDCLLYKPCQDSGIDPLADAEKWDIGMKARLSWLLELKKRAQVVYNSGGGKMNGQKEKIKTLKANAERYLKTERAMCPICHRDVFIKDGKVVSAFCAHRLAMHLYQRTEND
jgi:hypothetical protein